SIEGDSDPQEMVPRLIALNQAGEFDVDGLIATYPFSEINTAVADVLFGKGVKPGFVWVPWVILRPAPWGRCARYSGPPRRPRRFRRRHRPYLRCCWARRRH